MWFTFGATALILALWLSKMFVLKRVVFKRTVFDIPILIFLIAHIISTVISLDPHISLWGYYSRWNGGLFSIITYLILYYAFVSNFFSNEIRITKNIELYNPTGTTVIKRSLFISIISGLIVAVWSLPSHFGYDPTCLAFRGTLDVSCWTADFQPKIRIFGPLGQPDWLAGYMGILLPVTAGFIISTLRKTKKLLDPYLIFYSVSFLLFYLCLLYSGSRSGIIATGFALLFFVIMYLLQNRHDLSFAKNKFTAVFLIILLISTFFAGVSLPIINRFSYGEIKDKIQSSKTNPTTAKSQAAASSQPAPVISALDAGGSNSLSIRKVVWKGAFDTWKANPIFGTGVETFAFAYYKYRPIEHNNLSEWNFLYNKAHNEYLNYLATTGLLGFLSYMAFIILFIFVACVNILNKRIRSPKFLGPISASSDWDRKDPLILALLSSFISILIINFFGFSVVILNVFLLLIPAFVLILLNLIKTDETNEKIIYVGYPQWTGISGFFVVAGVIIFFLIKFWIADTKYALGSNYNHAGDFQTAYPLLQGAVDMRKEPVFEDELSINKATLALALAQQQQQQQGGTQSAQIIQKLATESMATSDKLIKEHPHNVIYWKSRVRILYTLANFDPRFMPMALEAIKSAAALAPTDASILYNLGVLYGQNGDSTSAAKVLEQTIAYKPNYREAYYALGLFYHDLGVDATTGKIKDLAFHQKAIDQMNFILINLDPNYSPAKESLSAWKNEK